MFGTIKDFTADQFAPTRWEGAEEKARFARRFIRFVESDFAEREFPDTFYRRLALTFGHIAHLQPAGLLRGVLHGRRGQGPVPPHDAGPPLLGRSGLHLLGRGAGLAELAAPERRPGPVRAEARRPSRKLRSGRNWPGSRRSTQGDRGRGNGDHTGQSTGRTWKGRRRHWRGPGGTFPVFAWHRGYELEDADRWMLWYTSSRDAGLLEQSNEKVVQ